MEVGALQKVMRTLQKICTGANARVLRVCSCQCDPTIARSKYPLGTMALAASRFICPGHDNRCGDHIKPHSATRAGMRQLGFILHGNADQSLGIKADRVRRQWLSVIDDERVPGIRLHEGAETPIRVDIVGHHDATWP